MSRKTFKIIASVNSATVGVMLRDVSITITPRRLASPRSRKDPTRWSNVPAIVFSRLPRFQRSDVNWGIVRCAKGLKISASAPGKAASRLASRSAGNVASDHTTRRNSPNASSGDPVGSAYCPNGSASVTRTVTIPFTANVASTKPGRVRGRAGIDPRAAPSSRFPRRPFASNTIFAWLKAAWGIRRRFPTRPNRLSKSRRTGHLSGKVWIMCNERCRNRRITRRRLVETAGTSLAGITLAGGALTASRRAVTARQDAPVEITWGVQEDVDMEFRQEAIVEVFNQEHPDIQLVMEPIPGEDMDRVIATALQAVRVRTSCHRRVRPTRAANLAQAGLLLDLDDYATEQYRLGKSSCRGRSTRANSVASSTCSRTSWNAPSPTTGRSSSTRRAGRCRPTAPGIRGLAEEAIGKGIIPVAVGIGDCGLCTNWLVTIFFNTYAGPDAVYQALTGEIPFSDPVFVEAITLLNQYMQAGWIGGGVEQYFSTSFDTVHTQMADGSALMPGGHLVPDAPEQLLRRGGRQRQRLGLGADSVLPRGGSLPALSAGIGSTLSIAADSEWPTRPRNVPRLVLLRPAAGGRAGSPKADPGFMTSPIPYQASDFPESTDPRVAEISVNARRGNLDRRLRLHRLDLLAAEDPRLAARRDPEGLHQRLDPADYCDGMATLFSRGAGRRASCLRLSRATSPDGSRLPAAPAAAAPRRTEGRQRGRRAAAAGRVALPAPLPASSISW